MFRVKSSNVLLAGLAISSGIYSELVLVLNIKYNSFDSAPVAAVFLLYTYTLLMNLPHERKPVSQASLS
ncbi:hypothetical protein ARMGADRAFT_327282 [Armillaria gallica]|uniref:Uncharacterized protein n=1 Tax=Armillaria gallica TaxID=47427 RepID=A0A2H3DQ78_ARMGA|nr:hypothetical protein ARMGADRAFT_327282 [Armillaria gallica]